MIPGETIKLTIPETAWEEMGDEPGSHLLVQLDINGCGVHLEAVPVIETERADGGTAEQAIDGPEWISTAIEASADYDTVQTVEIRGRRYVLIATPHQL